MRSDFVCPICGKELHECPAPTGGSKKPLIIGLVAALAIGGAAAAYFLGGDPKPDPIVNPQPYPEDGPSNGDSVGFTGPERDTITVADPEPDPEPDLKPTPQPRGPKDLGYATWKGEMKNGLPHGVGTMTYKQSHLIDSRDPDARTADPGDYVMGEFSEGKLVQGRWCDKDNNVKGVILIGK